MLDGEADAPDVKDIDDAGTRKPRIRCPKCSWQPRKDDLWGCFCETAFHTFDTRGRCPGCGEQWDHTQCLSCLEWSPHLDWYEGDADDAG